VNRTVTLVTTDHGPVTLPEPSWCLGHADHVPCERVDLTHTGTEHHFSFEGDDLFVAMLSQDPHAVDPERQVPGVFVEQTDYSATLDYRQLRQLAAALTVHALRLRALADQLAEEGRQ
jgi:hypothetical protein